MLEPVSNIPGNGAMTVPYGLANSIIHKRVTTKFDDSVEFLFVCRSYYTEDCSGLGRTPMETLLSGKQIWLTKNLNQI